jgi:hypothetical protein
MAGVAALSDGQRATIREKADRLLQRIEQEPKSGKWRKRDQTGTKKPWYNEVSDWA